MKNMKRILLTVVAAMLLVVMSVAGTLAYLTVTTNPVTNTFKVGDVSFDLDSALDEGEIYAHDDTSVTDDKRGTHTPDYETKRVTENVYKLVPSKTYDKDPIVHMSDVTEDAWLFVKVDNGIAAIEHADVADDLDTEAVETVEKIATQMKRLGWTQIAENSPIWYYKEEVGVNDDIPVFETFTLADDADVAQYADAKITIQAYAVQSQGFATALEAWEKAPLADWQ